MEDINTINLKSKDEKIIQCDSRILNFSQILKNSPDKSSVILCNLHDASLLQKIIDFYEIFDYDENELKVEEFDRNINSDKLRDNFSKKVLRYLKCWIINQSKVDIDQMEEITEACYYYDFNDLKICLLRAMGTEFYCGNSERDMEEYKKKFELPEEIHPDEQYRIINVEFKEVFDNLNKQLQEELKKSNPTIVIPDGLKKDLEQQQQEENKQLMQQQQNKIKEEEEKKQ